MCFSKIQRASSNSLTFLPLQNAAKAWRLAAFSRRRDNIIARRITGNTSGFGAASAMSSWRARWWLPSATFSTVTAFIARAVGECGGHVMRVRSLGDDDVTCDWDIWASIFSFPFLYFLMITEGDLCWIAVTFIYTLPWIGQITIESEAKERKKERQILSHPQFMHVTSVYLAIKKAFDSTNAQLQAWEIGQIIKVL